MESMTGPWAGNIYGTNIGKIFVELKQDGEALSGIARLNDNDLGLVVYSVTGTRKEEIEITCVPTKWADNVDVEPIQAKGELLENGNFQGGWETASGAGGKFYLFPHSVSKQNLSLAPTEPEQIYNRTVPLGSIRLFKEDIARVIQIARKDFIQPNMIVTYVKQGNDVTEYVDDFLAKLDEFTELRSLKLFQQEPGKGSINREINIELVEIGESSVRVSGPSDTWVTGKAESVRLGLKLFDSGVVTIFKKHGPSIVGFIFLGMLITMPSIPSLRRRFVFAASVVVLSRVVFAIQTKVVPNTLILIREKPKGLFARAWPQFVTWVLSVAGTVVAGLIFWWLTK
jgi:hypothetical protein